MEYQKIINLLGNTSNQPSKFRTKYWVEINNESTGTYNTNSQTNYKTTVLISSLCDYGDAYILVKGTITVPNTAAADADANNTNKKVILKNSAPFINCRSEINYTQVDNAKAIDIVMPMYNLIEYIDHYSKISGSLWQYCKDIPAVNNNGNIFEFNGANATDSFNFKAKITGQIGDNGTKRSFWRTLEIPLINYEINLILTWSANCVMVYTNVANEGATFAVTGTKFYLPVVTLSTQNNAKS